MAGKGEDPMSQLLSGVGGIDSSLFQKPQSMRNMRGQGSPGKKEQKAPEQAPSAPPHQAPASSRSSNQPTGVTHNSPANVSRGAHQSSGAAKNQSASDSNRQLDALLGEGMFSKSSRPMRDTAKPKPFEKSTGDAAEVPHAFQQQINLSQETATRDYSAGVQDDLDSVFGSVAQQQADNGNLNDPFLLFGGLGTTEQATPPQPSSGGGDFFSELSRGTAPASPDATDSPAAQNPGAAPRHRSVPSGEGSEDWGGMMTASPGLSSPRSSTATREDAYHSGMASPGFTSPRESSESRNPQIPASPVRTPLRRQQPSQLADRPPPSYEAVTRGKGLSSPVSAKLLSHSSGKYHIYRDEDNGGEDTGASPRPQRTASMRSHHSRSSSSEKPKAKQQAATQQPPDLAQAQIKDQAKQWLTAGQKWLSGAGKKVAQAVKETQAQINSRLDELDGRTPPSGGPNNSGAQQPNAEQRSNRQGGSSVDDVPAYYFEWAATIDALPAHEQGSTLAAMPEEDARTIQRILRHNARRRSMDETEGAMMVEAQRRSLSDETISWQPSSTASPHGAARRSRSSELQPGIPERQAPKPETAARAARPQSASIHRHDKRTPTSRPQPQQARSQEDEAKLTGLDSGKEMFRQAPPKTSALQPLQAVNGDVDLMGIHGQPSASEPQAARQSQTAEQDLLDLSGESPAPPRSEGFADVFGRQPAPVASRANDVPADLQDLFGTGPSQAPRAGGNAEAMIDFGEEEGVAGHEGLYQHGLQDEEQEGEPEARKIARRKRLAEKHARMQRQLAEKHARDRAEAQQQDQQHELRAFHRTRIEAWKSGKKDNIRALLSTLHTVLWENSGWSAPGMTDLVEAGRVKRSYMKANLVVHPDKVKQRGGSVEQIVIADMAFDALKTAWSKFEAAELSRR